MGLRVATNTQSLAAQRHLSTNTDAQRASQEKLASGSRITKAADDAAGLAISSKMSSHIRSVRQGTRNAQDGVSLIQVAEGGMNEIGNILVRMRELSMQAASDTVGDVERGFIDKEVQQLKSEVDRIAGSTEYNGHKLLAGEGKTMELQVGIHNDPEKDRFIFDGEKANVTASRLGVSGMSVASREAAQQNLDQIDEAIKTLSENRSDMGALQNRLQSTINNLRVYDENLAAAKSRIYDVDVAQESAELVRNNILSQTSTAVLSQANSNNTSALKLI